MSFDFAPRRLEHAQHFGDGGRLIEQLEEPVLREAEFGGCERSFDRLIKPLGHVINRLAGLRQPVEAERLEGRLEPVGIFGEHLVERRRLRILAENAVRLCVGAAVGQNGGADVVLLADHAVGVARHARQPGDDRAVRLLVVGDDFQRALVDPLAVAVRQHVTLQAVRQVEDDLAAVMIERIVAVRSERMLQDVLLADAGREVVTHPESAERSLVPLDHAVVVRDAGLDEPCADYPVVGDVLTNVDADLDPLRQFIERCRDLQQFVIERGP